LPCVFGQAHGKQPMFAVRFSGRRTAKVVPRRLAPVPLVAFVCRVS
jgi:hypothetical protein